MGTVLLPWGCGREVWTTFVGEDVAEDAHEACDIGDGACTCKDISASMVLDGFSVEEVTAAEEELER